MGSSVRPPGPPSVRTKTSPNELKFQMKSSAVMAKATGAMEGHVTAVNRRHAPAPSREAASWSSAGGPLNTPTTLTPFFGIPPHTPRPHSHDDDGRQCQLEAAKPVDAVCDETERVQHSVEDSSIGVINKFPQNGNNDRRHRPRHERERPCQPLEFEPRVEQQRKPQCEKELDGGDRERPDQPNLE